MTPMIDSSNMGVIFIQTKGSMYIIVPRTSNTSANHIYLKD
jgi:hypothetical protein